MTPAAMNRTTPGIRPVTRVGLVGAKERGKKKKCLVKKKKK
jgi:hypothetical protein